jgi:hypothetical protein
LSKKNFIELVSRGARRNALCNKESAAVAHRRAAPTRFLALALYVRLTNVGPIRREEPVSLVATFFYGSPRTG